MKKCWMEGKYRYTWPGKDESFVCEAHAGQLKAVAEAMGLYLQLIPLDLTGRKESCQQEVG